MELSGWLQGGGITARASHEEDFPTDPGQEKGGKMGSPLAVRARW